MKTNKLKIWKPDEEVERRIQTGWIVDEPRQPVNSNVDDPIKMRDDDADDRSEIQLRKVKMMSALKNAIEWRIAGQAR